MGGGASARVEKFGQDVNRHTEQVDVLRTIVDELTSTSNALLAQQNAIATAKIFIEGLPENCSDAMVRAYFQRFGHITEYNAFVKTDYKCGYVIFEEQCSVEAVTNAACTHMLGGQEIMVTKCVPCADAEDIIVVDDVAQRKAVAERLASKGFTVAWLLAFWRKYAERPPPRSVLDFKQLFPAEGEWMGVIKKTSTTNEVVRNIVIPETASTKCCFMDLAQNSAKTPDRLISHWWGASFYGDILCIVQDATGLRGDELEWYVDYNFAWADIRDDILSRSYWMCIFAVNQHVSICGVCNDCNVVNTGKVCRICKLKLHNPCACGIPKYKSGHILCEMDKFDEVMGLMNEGLLVALDVNVHTLQRVWVLCEIGKSLAIGKSIHWQMPNDIDDVFCGASEVRLASVRDCSATLRADKDRILKQIESTVPNGIAGFDAGVAAAIHPILRNYAIIKLIKNERPLKDVELLLERWADVETEIEMGRNLVFEAARLGQAGVTQLLIVARGNANRVDRQGLTPLHQAVAKGHCAVVSVLTDTKAHVDVKNQLGESPLNIAARYGHLDIVSSLVEVRAINDLPNNEGVTPIFQAAAKGHVRIVEALVASRADATRPTSRGCTPLQIAERRGHRVVVESLLAAIDARKQNGAPPPAVASSDSVMSLGFCIPDVMEELDRRNSFGAQEELKEEKGKRQGRKMSKRSVHEKVSGVDIEVDSLKAYLAEKEEGSIEKRHSLITPMSKTQSFMQDWKHIVGAQHALERIMDATRDQGITPQQLFARLDVNERGCLAAHELDELFLLFHPNLSFSARQAMLRVFDPEGTNDVELSDFIRAFSAALTPQLHE